MKEAGADAVKVEGARGTLSRVAALVDGGIPVMGHIGLTPQSATMLGGYKAQGRTAAEARNLHADAIALQSAGCFALVLEAIPAPVAAHITGALRIPTIGIGSGVACDGQVLVWHDLLGLTSGHVPRFVKQYADIGGATRAALTAYVADVRASRFPETQHTYSMADDELARFEADVAANARHTRRRAGQTKASARRAGRRLRATPLPLRIRRGRRRLRRDRCRRRHDCPLSQDRCTDKQCLT